MAAQCAMCRCSLDPAHGQAYISLSNIGKHMSGFSETLRLVSDAVCSNCNHSCQHRFDELYKRYPRLRDDGTINPDHVAAMDQYVKENRERIHANLLNTQSDAAGYRRLQGQTTNSSNQHVSTKAYSPRRKSDAAPTMSPVVVQSPAATRRAHTMYADPNDTMHDDGGAGALTIANTTMMVGGPASQAASNSVAESHRALLRAEREVDLLRDEMHRVRGDLEMARDGVEKEREEKSRLVQSMTAQREQLRDEYDRRARELQEQITVLKGLNEAASDDRARLVQEGENRKRHLTSLIENERREKTQLLDEYRTQTETLLSEQGKEIEALRALLETANAREKSLSTELHDMQQRRVELESAVLKWETQLMDERAMHQKKLQEREAAYSMELTSVQEAKEKGERELRTLLEHVTAAKEKLADSYHHASTQLESERMTYASEREEARRKHERELDNAVRELRDAKAWRDKLEEQTQHEIERMTRESEEMVTSLRKELETIRKEKQDAFEQARVTKESMMSEHQSRLQQMQLLQDSMRKELSEERQMRKEIESSRQAAILKLDQAQAEILRLHSEAERSQIESRQSERQHEQEHNHTVEQIKNQLRVSETELMNQRSQIKKMEDEVRHWVNQTENKENDLTNLRMEARGAADEARQQIMTLTAQLEELRMSSTKSLDGAQNKRLELEAELARAQRLVEELNTKLSVATKNLTAERRQVENLSDELNRTQNALDREKSSHHKSLNLLVEKDQAVDALTRAKEELQGLVRQHQTIAQNLKSQLEQEIKTRDETHREMLDDRRAVENQLQSDINNLEDQVRARNATIQELERVVHQHRDALSRVEGTLREQDIEHQRRTEESERRYVDELNRMEGILGVLKDDLGKANNARYTAQRESADRLKDLDRQLTICKENLESERLGRVRAVEESRAKDQIQSEHQGTIRMLSARLQTRDEEMRKLENELQASLAKYQEVTVQLGRKDSHVHQLMARIRALEARSAHA